MYFLLSPEVKQPQKQMLPKQQDHQSHSSGTVVSLDTHQTQSLQLTVAEMQHQHLKLPSWIRRRTENESFSQAKSVGSLSVLITEEIHKVRFVISMNKRLDPEGIPNTSTKQP